MTAAASAIASPPFDNKENLTMQVTFYGGVREVTGSMHLLSTDHDRILLDCGMFQGRRKESSEKNRILPFDPALITNVVLSHAHIDHSGRIPMLTRARFNGRIVCTRVSAEACKYLLLDSAHIQESDAEYLNYKTARSALREIRCDQGRKKLTKKAEKEIKAVLKTNGDRLHAENIRALLRKHRLEEVQPLYTVEEAQRSMSFFDGYPYGHPITIGRNLTCTFYEAGHILGSALSVLRFTENGRSRNVLFTGDLGRFQKPILRNPALDFLEEDRNIDLMIMESTYGDRRHEPVQDLKPRLREVIEETAARGGTILIPSFAYGRTQELIYFLHEIYDAGDGPKLPIYIDSPLATKITEVFGQHPEVYDRETHRTFLEQGKNPFRFDHIHFVESVEESMALNRNQTPHIVIAGSGMCEGGRILHHLRHKIHDERNTVLVVGFMARHTLGRRILDLGEAYEAASRQGEPPMVKFYNKEYPLRARVIKLGGFSAHADRDEMMAFLKKSNLDVKRIAVVHGEEEQSLGFSDLLRQEGFDAFVPMQGETVQIR